MKKFRLPLLVLTPLFLAALFSIPHFSKAASADITLTGNAVATIEADTTQRTATVSGVKGYISNGGSVKVFIHTAAGTVVTTDAQAQSLIGLPAGASIPLPQGCQAFTYKTASSTSVLYWTPTPTP